jgi:tetraacyldisaccharide-1-P 4'-kinase
LSFCGIARPERFLEALAGLGITPVRHLAFPDHHGYPPATVRKIEAAVRDSGAEAVLMTEKDAVKWRDLGRTVPPVRSYYLEIGLVLPDDFHVCVRRLLGRSPEARS